MQTGSIPLGRSDKAIAELKQAVELEPLSINAGANLSRAYFFARRYDEALNEAQKVYDLDSRPPLSSWVLAQSYIGKEMYADAIALCEKVLTNDPTNQTILRFAGIAYAKSGRRKDAEEIIKKFDYLTKTQYVVSMRVAQVYAALGEKEKAFVELEKAYSERDWELPCINVDPLIEPLRDDPRYKDLLKRMGLPE